MTYRRLLVLYVFSLCAFFMLLVRVFLIASNTPYGNAAQKQTITTLTLDAPRGNFYDCEGTALTGVKPSWYALCIPGESSYADLYGFVNKEAQSVLYQKRNSAVPFLIPVEQDLSPFGIYTLHGSMRYSELAIAPHLLGYVSQDGNGITGLELAFNETLLGSTEQSYVQCITNAQGALLAQTEPTLYQAEETGEDIQLTISKKIQRITEGVADSMMDTGAIVVLDSETAKVRASVSVPSYHPNAVADSLHSENAVLLNRVFSAYSVGSVFKPVLAAVAISEGLDWFTVECKGYVNVNGQIYHCANGVAHGQVNLNTAMEKSCNCYFIGLGQLLGGDKIVDYAQQFGIGQPTYLADALKTAEGNLPNSERLADVGQLANVSFGQGELTATPLQLAGMMNTIAANGVYRTPSYVEGVCRIDAADKCQITRSLSEAQSRQVITPKTAAYLKAMLIDVVEEGTATAAKPEGDTAGGKTGTAQTGRYNENGEEYKNLWFAGFYPADSPRYTIVVMQDDQTDAAYTSAAVFAKVCESISLLEKTQETCKNTDSAS